MQRNTTQCDIQQCKKPRHNTIQDRIFLRASDFYNCTRAMQLIRILIT